MSGNNSLVPVTKFFEEITLPEDQIARVRELTEDVLDLEMNRGMNALHMGKKLVQVRNLLVTQPKVGTITPWSHWCKTFVYSQDYANRLIQIAEIFDENTPGLSQLTPRHLREIARFSDTQVSREEMVKLVADNNLGVHAVRFLATEVKQGRMTLEDLMKVSTDLKSDVEKRMREARRESKEKIDEANRKVAESSVIQRDLEEKLANKTDDVETLVANLREREAATILGEGNDELGQMKIDLQRLEQVKDNLELALNQTQAEMRKMKNENDRATASPLGKAQGEIRQLIGSVEKFFKETMSPVYLAVKASAVNPADRLDLGKLVDAIDNWAHDVRVSLEDLERA
jgi:hypothetical protein